MTLCYVCRRPLKQTYHHTPQGEPCHPGQCYRESYRGVSL